MIVGDAKKIGLIDGEKASMQTVPLSKLIVVGRCVASFGAM
jgi:hypothetical protein